MTVTSADRNGRRDPSCRSHRGRGGTAPGGTRPAPASALEPLLRQHRSCQYAQHPERDPVLFLCLTIAYGSWRDALFVGILISNIGIGSFQEIRSKRALDRLASLVSPDAVVVRDGVDRRVPPRRGRGRGPRSPRARRSGGRRRHRRHRRRARTGRGARSRSGSPPSCLRWRRARGRGGPTGSSSRSPASQSRRGSRSAPGSSRATFSRGTASISS